MFGDQVKISFKRKISPFISPIIIIFLVIGCGQRNKPSGLLTEPEMVKVLTEIYIAEEKAAHMSISHDSIKKIFPQFEARILEKEGLSDSLFHVSMEYYKAHPKELESIYAAVVDSLSLHAQRLAPAPTPAQ